MVTGMALSSGRPTFVELISMPPLWEASESPVRNSTEGSGQLIPQVLIRMVMSLLVVLDVEVP